METNRKQSAMLKRMARLKQTRQGFNPNSPSGRELARSVEMLNQVLAVSAEAESEQLLRRILQARALANVNKNSLPGLF